MASNRVRCEDRELGLCEAADCTICHEKSMAGASATADMERVGVEFVKATNGATIRQIPARSRASTFKVVFLCLLCVRAIPIGEPMVRHEFTAQPYTVLGAAFGEDPCPYTRENRKAVCGKPGCTRCGIAAHADALFGRDLAFEAGPLATDNASSYSAGSHAMCTWKCLKPTCGHSFIAMVENVLGQPQSKCPFCSYRLDSFCKDPCGPCRKRTVAAGGSTWKPPSSCGARATRASLNRTTSRSAARSSSG